MRTRLLVAGMALTLLAVGSEERLSAGNGRATGVMVTANVPSDRQESADHVVASVSGTFDSAIADAVLTGIRNAEDTLKSYQPMIRAGNGANGEKAKKLAAEIADACAHARAELTEGRTVAALDNAVQASSRLDEMRKLFERR